MTRELRLGDSRDPVLGMPSLPARSVDHVIFDPPYHERVHARFHKARTVSRQDTGLRDREELEFEALSDGDLDAFAREACRIARGWILVFCADLSISAWADALEKHGALYVRTGLWVKTDAPPQVSGDRPGTGEEYIAIAHAPREVGTGAMKWNGGGRCARYTGPAKDGNKRVHPTQKPAWLMEALLRDFTQVGQLVCDPTAGSGTTGVACARLGRSFLGWERDLKHFAAARTRIDSEREQLDLAARPTKPQQTRLDMAAAEGT